MLVLVITKYTVIRFNTKFTIIMFRMAGCLGFVFVLIKRSTGNYSLKKRSK